MWVTTLNLCMTNGESVAGQEVECEKNKIKKLQDNTRPIKTGNILT